MLSDGRSVIFTFAYSGSNGDTTFLKHLAASAVSVGASVHFVQLKCLDTTLLKRVSNPNRHRFRKLTDPQKLAEALRLHDYNRQISEFENIEIDTDQYSPDAAASVIVKRIR